jgi:hypothetical protein
MNELQGLQESFYEKNGFPGVIGAIDGTHVCIVNPGGVDSEIYRNRKGHFSINVQIFCDHNLTIRDIVASWPGSTHDARIFAESLLKDKLETLPSRFHVLGDRGYPCLRYLLTPIPNPRTASEKQYNYAQSSTRMVVERLNGVLKRRFPCLGSELRFSRERCAVVVVACAVLHNLARLHADDFEDVDFQETDEGQEGHQDPSTQGAAKRRHIINNYF